MAARHLPEHKGANRILIGINIKTKAKQTGLATKLGHLVELMKIK